MVEGELYVNIPVPSGTSMMGGMISMPGMSIGNIGVTEEMGLRWREKTGEKKGFLIKSDEVRTMAVKGRRCIACGLVELYAKAEE
jgi:hypothetical protein